MSHPSFVYVVMSYANPDVPADVFRSRPAGMDTVRYVLAEQPPYVDGDWLVIDEGPAGPGIGRTKIGARATIAAAESAVGLLEALQSMADQIDKTVSDDELWPLVDARRWLRDLAGQAREAIDRAGAKP